MKRIVSIIASVVLISMLVYAGIQAFASDESRIRSQINAITKAFNDRSTGDFIGAFDPKYRDATTPELDRILLDRALRYLFLTRVQKGEGFTMHIEVPEESIEIDIVESAEQATVVFEVKLEERSGEEWELLWHVRIEGRMRKSDGDWLFYRTEHSTIEGKRPH